MSSEGPFEPNDDLGGGRLSDPTTTDDELGAFLRDSIPTPRADYWESIDDRLAPQTPGGSDGGGDSVSDELSRFLRGSIPAPTVGYWDTIDARLAAAERDQSDADSSDTTKDVVRPMAMETTPPTSSRTSMILAAAAALVLLAGIGTFAALNRGGDGDGDVELATQPQPVATETQSAESSETGDTDQGAAAQPTTTAPAAGSGPLATMQTRRAGDESDGDTLFCFAAPETLVVPVEEPPVGLAVVQLSVQFNGSYSFLALQNDQWLIFAAGDSSADGVFETAPIGISGLSGILPPYLVTLTDTSISFGEDSTLQLVSCSDVETQVQIMRTMIEESQGTDANETAEVAAPIANDAVLSSTGLGPIRVGMLVSEASAELGVVLTYDTIDGGDVAGDCGWINRGVDDDVWVLVETTGDGDAFIRRISTASDRWATPSGVRVGMTEQQIIDTFPNQLDIQPHVYVEDGNYLRFIPNDVNDPNTVEFVTEFGVLVEIRAGADGWVSLVEGCA